MIRLLFVVVLATVLAIAFTSLHSALSPARAPLPPVSSKGSTMPAALKKISYGLLILLMFGIVTGWIGG